jgi:hypothetical protein
MIRDVGQDAILRRVVNPPERRLAIGAQVSNLPHIRGSEISW